MTIPQFNFSPSPDFMQGLKVGSGVYLWSGSSWSRNPSHECLEEVKVVKVTPKTVTIINPRSGSEMRFKKSDRLEYGSLSKYPAEIFPCNAETIAICKELERRKLLISNIKKAAEAHGFGKMLSTESLNEIAKLMEVKS